MPHKLSPAKSTSCLLSIDLNQSLANPFHNHSMNRIRTSNLNHSDLIHSNSKQQQQQQHLHPHPHHPHHHLQHHPLEQSSHHNNTVIPSKSVSTSYGKDSIGLIESNPNETNYPHPHHHHHNHRNLNHLDQQEQRTNLFDCSFCWSSSNLVCCQSSSSSLSSSSSSSSPSSPSSSFAKQSLPTPSSSIGSTTTTIDTQNSSAWFGKCRNVRLRRTDPNQSLGFSIRGGWEYGIGFYISDVQPNSLAAQQGLCPGDQIFRINGFPLDRVIHDEVVSLIRMSSNDLTLRVRSVGVVPLKNHSDDKLTWKRLCVQHSHHQHNNHLNHHHHHQMRTGTSTTCSASSDVSSFIFQRPRSASSLTTPSSTISSVSDDHLSSSDELIHLPLLSSSTLQEQKDSSPIMTNEYPQQQQQQQQQPIQNSHSFHQLSPSGPNDYPLSPTCSTPPSSSSTLIQSSIESMRHCDEKKLCLQGHRPGSSLGFSVVNGPINCPGIFVQNVKDGKLAQKCGLEIGDQIVRVNDHDVSIIGFDGAIAILKSTTNINLIVRKGVARHIFECRDRYTTINSCNLSKKSTDSSSSTTSLSKCHYSKLYSSSSTSTSSLSSSSTLMTHHQSSKSSKIKTKHKLSKTLNGKGMLYSVPGSIQPPPLPPPPPPPPPPLPSPSSSTHKSSTYVSTNTSTLDATGSLMINQQSNSNGNEQIISSIYDCATNPMDHNEQCQSTCPAYSSIKITGSCLSTVSGEQDQCCCRLQCYQQSDRFRNICQIYSTSNPNQLDYQSRIMNNSNEDSVNHLIDINNPPHHHHHHDHYLQQQQQQHQHRHQNQITSAPSIPSLLQNLNHVDQVTDAVRNSLRILQEVRRKEEKLMEASRKLNEEHEKLFREKQRLEYEKKEMMLSNNAQKTIDENVKENLYQPAHFVTRINDCGGGGGGGQNKKSNEQQHFSSSSSSSLSPSSSSTVMAIPKTPPPPPPKIPIVSCSKIFSQTSSSQHLYSTIGPNGSASKSSSSSIETPSQDLQDDLDCGKISSPSSSSSQSSSSLSPSIPRSSLASSLASSSSSSSSTLSTPSSSLVFAPLANSISTPQFSFLEEIKAMGENGHRRHLRPVNSLEVTEESGYSQQQQQSEKSSEITSIMSVNQTSVSWKASKTNQLLRRSVFGDFVPPTTKPSSESSNRQTKNLTQNVTNECSNTSNDDSSCCSGVGLQSKDASENKKRQHELLMEEFRIAHRKMFGGGQRKQSIDATLNRIQSKHKDNDTAVTNTDNINANNNVDIDASAAGVSESNTLGDRFDNEDEDRKEKRNDRILNKNISDDKEIHKDVNKISCEAIAVVNRQDDDHKTIGSMKKILMRTLNDHQRSTSSSSTTSSKSSNQDKQKQSLKCDTKNQSKILINARNKSGLFANIRKTTQTNNSDCKGNDQKGKSGSDEENRLETSNNKTSNGPNISLASIITATAAVVNASTGTSTVSSSPSIKINVSSRRDNNCDQSANNDDIDDDRDRIENNKGNLNNKSSSPSSTSSSSSPTKSISTTKSIANDRPVLSSFAVTKNTSHPYRSQQQQQQNQSNRSSINTVDVTNGGDCTGSKSSSSSSVNSSEMVKKKSPSIFSLSTIKHSNNGDGNQNPNSKNSIDCQQTMINARSTNEIVSQSSTLASGPAPPPVASSSSTSTSIVGNGNNLTNRITIKVLSPKIST